MIDLHPAPRRFHRLVEIRPLLDEAKAAPRLLDQMDLVALGELELRENIPRQDHPKRIADLADLQHVGVLAAALGRGKVLLVHGGILSKAIALCEPYNTVSVITKVITKDRNRRRYNGDRCSSSYHVVRSAKASNC